MQEAEAFLRSKVWAPTSTSKATEQRLCRGRTQNEELPPTFQIDLIHDMSEGSIEKGTLWLLHRQGDEVLNRVLEMAFAIEPKRSIKDTMGRRER
eukprot:3737297-Lingulodinium_polyedra.AAC.1